MEETISLQDLFETIRKRLGLIVLLTMLAVIIAGAISYFLLPSVYETSSEILVNQTPAEAGQLINQNIQTDLQLINTYSGIIKSPAILDQVVDELNLQMTSDQLKDDISVSNEKHSQIITITVRNENPARAVEIANTTADIFEKDIEAMMEVDNISILSGAAVKENPEPVSLSFRSI